MRSCAITLRPPWLWRKPLGTPSTRSVIPALRSILYRAAFCCSLLVLPPAVLAEGQGSWGCTAKPEGGWNCGWSGQGSPPPAEPAPAPATGPALAPLPAQPSFAQAAVAVPIQPQDQGESSGWFASGINTLKGWMGLEESAAAANSQSTSQSLVLPGLEDLQPGQAPTLAPLPTGKPGQGGAQTWALPLEPLAPTSPVPSPAPTASGQPVASIPLTPAASPQPQIQAQNQNQEPSQGGFAPWNSLKRWLGMGSETPAPAASPAPVAEGAAPQAAAPRPAPHARPIQPTAPAQVGKQAPSQASRQAAPGPRPQPVQPSPLPGDEHKIHVIQIQSASQRAGLKALSDQLGLGPKAWIHEEQRNGAPWFSLFYGRYASLNQALDAMQSLPQAVQQRGPWVRKLEISR